MEKKERIQEYDILKGFAIAIVCIGHIIQSISSDFSDLKVYSIIFAIQMPLFMIVSGYFGVKKTINNVEVLLSVFKKRLIAYMIPFFSSFLFRMALSLNKSPLIELLKKVFTVSMDSGLWYLWVIFFLYLALQLAVFTKNKIFSKKPLANIASFVMDTLLFGIYLIPWALIAAIGGSSFLGSKFVLYYSLFYYAGYVYREYIEQFLNDKKRIDEAVSLVCIVLGIVISSRMNFVLYPDTIQIIILRAFTGLALSYGALYIIVKKHLWKSSKCLQVLGENSLEIYYVHGIGFSLLGTTNKVALYSIDGQLTFLFSCLLTIIYTYLVVKIVHRNKYLNLFIFGKSKQ